MKTCELSCPNIIKQISRHMDLKNFIEFYSIPADRLATLLGTDKEAITRWKKRYSRPRAHYAEKIIEISGGDITQKDLEPIDYSKRPEWHPPKSYIQKHFPTGDPTVRFTSAHTESQSHSSATVTPTDELTTLQHQQSKSS